MTNDPPQWVPLNPTFHDDSIYGFRLVFPQPERNDWRSELILDIDHIVEWRKGGDGRIRFLLAQANLCFENLSDLQVSFAFPETSLYPLPIDRVECSDKPVVARGNDYREFAWRIRLNDITGGSLAFRSTGYRLEPIGSPVEYDEQTIPQHCRK